MDMLCFLGTVLSYQVCDDLPDSAINVYGSGSQSMTLQFRAPTVNGIDRGFIITILYTGSCKYNDHVRKFYNRIHQQCKVKISKKNFFYLI